MQGMTSEVRVVLHDFKALRGVSLVFLGRITAHSSHTGFTLFRAFEMDSHPRETLLLGHAASQSVPNGSDASPANYPVGGGMSIDLDRVL